jgi:hypothetical protein
MHFTAESLNEVVYTFTLAVNFIFNHKWHTLFLVCLKEKNSRQQLSDLFIK